MGIFFGILLVIIVAIIVKPVIDLISKGFKKLKDKFSKKKE